MKEIWMGGHQHRSISPSALKRAIELFAPQFSGVQQQDSAEFVTYLLDALHEDTNRVRHPPYVEFPDVDLSKKLSISGAEVRFNATRRLLLSLHLTSLLHQPDIRHGTSTAFATQAKSLTPSMGCTRTLVSVPSVIRLM